MRNEVNSLSNRFRKVIENYIPLLQLWKESLEEKLDFETKSLENTEADLAFKKSRSKIRFRMR